LSDFAEYHPFNGPMLNTANKDAPLQVKGDGTVFLTHSVKLFNGSRCRVITCLHPVYHVPGMEVRLMSMRELLLNGNKLQGDAEMMCFLKTISAL
jgi:hypothetical protein